MLCSVYQWIETDFGFNPKCLQKAKTIAQVSEWSQTAFYKKMSNALRK